MRIGIDAREIVGQPTGVGRYLHGVLEVWALQPDIASSVTLFVPTPPASSPAWMRSLHVETAASPRGGTWWEQMQLPAAVARRGIDVFFSPGYTLPLRVTCSSVVAIHDVSFFAHPEWFRPREGVRRRWLTRASARRARRIVTISEFSAREIVRWLGVPRSRIVIAPPGAPPATTAGTTPREPLVLFVGSIFTRRRIPELLRGFAAAVGHVPDARLVLVGDNRTYPVIDPMAMAAELGLANRVTWTQYAADADLERLYGRARVFAFLSDYEGFAMTPLEALSHGVPSVLLDTDVSREVYGAAARLVPPDPSAIGAALVELLTSDRARADLVAAGAPVLARTTWTQAAATVLGALSEATRP